MMGQMPPPPDHPAYHHHPHGMPPMMPPMHPSDMMSMGEPPSPHHHHGGHSGPHHHHGGRGNDSHSNMMAEFPQPPPPERFMPPRPRTVRQPPRVPNRIIVESSGGGGNLFDPHGRTNRGGHDLLDNDMPKRKERAPSSSSFPTKLYKILADPNYREYVAWLPHGRAWRVLKPKAFEEDVIPKFFRSERYASFMRQVRCFAGVAGSRAAGR
jgi:hypothetical protein